MGIPVNRLREGIVLVLFLLVYAGASGQGEANIWYFGNGIGLDFNSGSPPALLTDGAMYTIEGCATVSDKNGHLLFYTDGMDVWDRRHKRMPLGTGLGGNTSSTQSAIIVPDPSDTNQYYIFTTNAFVRGIEYSIVNMQLNGGYGDIQPAYRNIKLLSTASEKLTAVTDPDDQGYWVLGHSLVGKSFYAWKVTLNGVSNPIVSSTGAYHASTDYVGYMKPDKSGEKIAACISTAELVEIYDFDKESGVVSNLLSLSTSDYPYGCEFSPSGRFLYVSGAKEIRQYDLSQKTEAEIEKSSYLVATPTGLTGALQIGPDGNMYISGDPNGISVILKPNEAGKACEYRSIYIKAPFQRVQLGLPFFLHSYFDTIPKLISEINCLPQASYFYCKTKGNCSFRWNFGDTASGTGNISLLPHPKHIFASPGNYEVTVIIQDGFGDTAILKKSISVFKNPEKKLPPKVTACEGSKVTLDAGNPGARFLWNTGDTLRTIEVSKAGLYKVRISNNECVLLDSCEVLFKEKPLLNLEDSAYLCPGDTKLLDAGISDVDYIWSTGDTSRQISVTKPGVYSLRVSNGACEVSDSIKIITPARGGIESVDSRYLCDSYFVSIMAGPGTNYNWYPSRQKTKLIRAKDNGWYKVSYQNGYGCKVEDSVYVKWDCDPLLFVPNAFTPDHKNGNEVFIPKGEGVDEFEMFIYNRWGERVFHTRNFNTGWVGTFHDAPAPEGVYVYLIKYKSAHTGMRLRKGTVTLMR